MAKFFNRFVLFWILQSPFSLILNTLTSLILASVISGGSSTIASAELAQITLSIDSTFVPTFSDLVNQAEALAEIEIYQRFQADSTISELQITVLGERNGQLVSLLSSKISRSEWQAGSDIRQSTRYFSTSSALLGYRNSDPISTRESTTISRNPAFVPSPSDTLEQARSSKRISEEEYWQLVDALD